MTDRETLLERARDDRASAARARRLSKQLLTKADQANLGSYADRLEAEADALEREAGAAARAERSRRRTSH